MRTIFLAGGISLLIVLAIILDATVARSNPLGCWGSLETGSAQSKERLSPGMGWYLGLGAQGEHLQELQSEMNQDSQPNRSHGDPRSDSLEENERI